MKLTVEHPYFLLLLPLLGAGILYTARWIRTSNKERKRMITGLRLAVISLIILTLSGIRVNWFQSTATTVFAVDVSESVSGQVEALEQFVMDALKEMPKKDKAAIIAFGGDARIEQFVSDKPVFSGVETMPITTSTNLEKAVQTAMGLFEEESGKRLVILTDGQENEGELKNTAAALAGSQVEVEIVKLTAGGESEVYVDAVKVPDKVAIGDSFPVEVEIKSNIATSAELSLYSGSVLKSVQSVELEKGENRFLFKDIQQAEGIKSYRVRIEPAADTKTANNEYVAFTRAEAEDRILLIEGEKGKGDAFVTVLEAANIAYQRVTPFNTPDSILELSQYRVVIMLDVYGDDLEPKFMEQIKSYVGDYGGGLAVIGGTNSFALGNYKGTPLEEVLPVYMDLKGEREVPETAIVMVIDRSGSMSSGDGNVTMLDLAKEAAAVSLKNLRSIDSVGVLAFESSFQWTWPLETMKNAEEIENEIYRIESGGGTSIYPAVEEAFHKLEASDAKIRHVILLTDGQDGFRNYGDLQEKMEKEEITLSTVAVGTDADKALLASLAKKGGGRAYYADINSDIPKIFAQEIMLSANTYLVNREFTPAAEMGSEILEGIAEEGMPAMYGYVAATKKERATLHLESDLKDPILTTWQYGLGKTAAFNSDGENKWTARYADWSHYPKLWKNIIGFLTTDTDSGDSSITARQEGNGVVLQYRTKNDTTDTLVDAVYTDESGNTVELSLQAIAPGVFEGTVMPEKKGIYSVNVVQKEGGQVTDTQMTAFAMQYSNEYRFAENSNTLEEFAIAGGALFIEEPGEVFQKNTDRTQKAQSLDTIFLGAAMAFFMADIINRRFYWQRKYKRKVKKPEEEPKKTAPIEKKEEQKSKNTRRKDKSSKDQEMLDTSALLKKKEERE